MSMPAQRKVDIAFARDRRRVLTAGLAACAASAWAQEWVPKRPINLIVPYTPGGSSDIGARMLAPELSQLLGQPVIVENVPGAAGALAMKKLVQSAPDGHTLLYGGMSETLLVPLINPAAGYKPEDLQPIALVGSSPVVLAVRPDFPAQNVDEWVAMLKRQPGKFSYGSAGIGSFAHVMGEVIKEKAGVFVVHIPYRGGQQLLNDVIGGQIDVAISTAANAAGMLAAKRVKALGISSAKRVDALKDVPTFAESTALKGIEMSVWALILAPKGTPMAAQQRLSQAINQVQMLPAMKAARVQVLADLPSLMSPAQAHAFLAAEQSRYAPVASRIKPE
jgi:tripartite-type tricarboxylate transporter receptor subunit TctC